MSLRPATRIFSLVCGTLLLIVAAGCGTGRVNLSNSSGNFSNASLKGAYAYQIHGTSQLGPYRESGVLTADGAGRISAGIDDFVTASTGLVTNSVTGSYKVANDGTGFLTFGPTPMGTITLAVTLVSKSKFDLIEADAFANSAGTAELQTTTAMPSGTYVYRLHQIGASSGQNPVSEVGAITISGGNVTGSFDQNFGGSSGQLTLTGTLSPPDSSGTGTGSFTDNTNFTTQFVYYAVNSGKFLLLVTNLGLVESGSAELQSGAASGGLAGTYVFGSRGDSGTFYDAVGRVGQFNASTGTISSYNDDSMSFGNYANSSLTGSYTASSNGRVAVTLGSGVLQAVFWMISPSRAFFLINNPSIVEDGTADLQNGSSFAASTFNGQFAMVMDGNDSQSIFGPEFLSRVGTLQFNGLGTLALNEVVNASNSGAGATSPGALSGNYQVSSGGRIVGSLNGSTLNLVMYAVSGSSAYVLQVDPATNTSGIVELQQ
ncbi:MAG TPA: hypothetical protein VFB00_05180 [Terriglobales bacterium]|nr:hypothetical protein [Terriglobales bacterium]